MPATATPEPLVSVVFTLMFPRGQVLTCIESWGNQQTLPREQIELIITGNGKDPVLEQQVKQALGERDQFLHVATDNEAAMYAHSAQHARGTWLLFTEAHVIAAPDTVEKLLNDVQARGLDGSCVKTLPSTDTQWAQRIEARMYEDDFKILSDECDWRKFTKRGFLLRRSAYETVGGLDARYHRYSVIPVGARLRDGGFRLGHTADAVVTHHNAKDLEETFDYAREYRRNEQLHLRNHPDIDVEGVLAEAHPDAALQKATRRAAWKSLRTWRPGSGQAAFPLLKSILPGPSPLTKTRWRYYLSRLQLALSGNNVETMYQRFQVSWQRFSDLALEELLAENSGSPSSQSAAPLGADGILLPADLPRHLLDGFYPAEAWETRRFRWTSVAASIRVDLPRNDMTVSLDVGGLLHPRRESVQLFWNGRPLKRVSGNAGHGRLAFRLKKSLFKDKQGQILSITCAPAAASEEKKDSRLLGLPVFQITFTHASKAAK
ncbi:glycosyltransferase [Roseimicrobium sp. ORNL1]|uniref:glycosyltransferase family 2 protein n=1 Tax=Roseimicrobium sp. ORNL1 TaxID=2711231 RepID=UPI0013E1B2E6|nr:glycosyltransferase [Roseimicrobium sp. ORNL1]QIF00118.1 glycosyltransferase [Roseimicrobium sp. ORNL1]